MCMINVSNRGIQWNEFSSEVLDHIEKYTVPQYGDYPDDMASNFTKSDIDLQLRKYVTRQCNGGGSRGQAEDMRDYLKIAHYACMAYMIMRANKEEQ